MMSKRSLMIAAAITIADACRAEAASDPLRIYRGTTRVLVALGASHDDPSVVAQRRLFAAMAAGARERDLVLVEALDGTITGAALRQRFGGVGFKAVLIGKDGGEKLAADQPLGPETLFPLIDAMPMRREEMHRAS